MPAACIDYVRAATLRATGLTYNEIASEMGVKAQSVRVGLSRRGLNRPASDAREMVLQRARETAELAVQQASKNSRVMMGEAIARDVEWLADAAPSRNGKDVCARYTQLAPVLAAAERVYGWRADDQPAAALSFSRVDVHVHDSAHDASPVLDCQTVASDTPSTPSTEPPAQVDATPGPATTP